MPAFTTRQARFMLFMRRVGAVAIVVTFSTVAEHLAAQFWPTASIIVVTDSKESPPNPPVQLEPYEVAENQRSKMSDTEVEKRLKVLGEKACWASDEVMLTFEPHVNADKGENEMANVRCRDRDDGVYREDRSVGLVP